MTKKKSTEEKKKGGVLLREEKKQQPCEGPAGRHPEDGDRGFKGGGEGGGDEFGVARGYREKNQKPRPV